jgi:preprotein translocase subunit SecA
MCKDKNCDHNHEEEAREVVDELEEELSPELEELYKQAAEDLARSEVAGLPSTDEASARGPGWGGVHKVTGRVNKEDGTKLGRNDPCSCGSGKKFKKCECWELLNG